MSKKMNVIFMKLKSIKSTMNAKNINMKNIIIVFLMPLFLVSLSDTAYSQKSKKKKSNPKKVRVINTSKAKANAIAILQTSETLTELANISPKETKESLAYSTKSNNSAKNNNATKSNYLAKNNNSKSNNSKNNSKNNNADMLQDTPKSMSDVEWLKTYLPDDDENEFVGEMGEDLAELEAEDDVKVNLDDFKSIWLLAIGGEDASSKTAYGSDKEFIMSLIIDWVGTPYRFGGVSRSAIDCSAWVRAIFYQADSIVLPRTAREQVNLGNRISREKLAFGDLVFFHTYSKKFASHVGIYLGDNLFAHASSLQGVTISSLKSTYYEKRFIGGRRFNESDYRNYKIRSNSLNY
jgi:cell wall-associated NlpC family hydrolase